MQPVHASPFRGEVSLAHASSAGHSDSHSAPVNQTNALCTHWDGDMGHEETRAALHVIRRTFFGALGFEITVALEELTEPQRRRLRPGMSATLEVVYDKPDALLVPIRAVEVRGGGTWLRVKDPASDEVRRVRVEPGRTTVGSVEILRGLGPGGEVVRPAR